MKSEDEMHLKTYKNAAGVSRARVARETFAGESGRDACHPVLDSIAASPANTEFQE